MYEQYRNACFWHSDIQDAIDALHYSASHYSPASREAFIRSVCEGALMDSPAVDSE